MVYIVENNGVYGLTKGQFSATADLGQKLKYAGVNNLPPLDICIEALAAGATFVARSFAGDPKPGGGAAQGCAVAIAASRSWTSSARASPSTTTKSPPRAIAGARRKETPLNELSASSRPSEEITIGDYESEMEVEMHDGSKIVSRSSTPTTIRPIRPRPSACWKMRAAKQQFITGLIYVNEEERPHLLELLQLTDEPLATLSDERVRPTREALQALMATL